MSKYESPSPDTPITQQTPEVTQSPSGASGDLTTRLKTSNYEKGRALVSPDAPGQLNQADNAQEGTEAPSPEQLAKARKMAQMRDQYEGEVHAIGSHAKAQLGAGVSEEDVARDAHEKRRALGVKYKDLTPAAKREQIYARNLKKYGDKLGPTIKYLAEKKKKSWGDIIAGAAKAGGEDIIPTLLAETLGRPDFETKIRTARGSGSKWADIVDAVASS